MPALADPFAEPAAEETAEHLPRLTIVERGLMSLRVSPRLAYWVAASSALTARFGARDRRGLDRLLVTEELDPPQHEYLEALFGDVLSGPASAFLEIDEIREVLSAPNYMDLAIGILVSELRQAVIVIRGSLERIVVPWSWFTPSGTGTTPDFAAVGIEDGGQTLRLGEYEAAMDAVLYEFDREYRARDRQRQLETDVSFGASLRRLRAQKGIPRSGFPGISAKEIARIERGEVLRPHPATLRVIADTLGVDVAEVGTF